MAEYKVKLTSHRAKIERELESKIHDALDLVGFQMESDAAKMCYDWKPTDIIDTGTLANSITHQMADSYTVVVGTNTPYAVYVEFGTGIYAENGQGRKTPWAYRDRKGELHWTRGVRPRPFLKTAIQNNLNAYQTLLAKYLGGDGVDFEDLLL